MQENRFLLEFSFMFLCLSNDTLLFWISALYCIRSCSSNRVGEGWAGPCGSASVDTGIPRLSPRSVQRSTVAINNYSLRRLQFQRNAFPKWAFWVKKNVNGIISVCCFEVLALLVVIGCEWASLLTLWSLWQILTADLKSNNLLFQERSS